MFQVILLSHLGRIKSDEDKITNTLVLSNNVDIVSVNNMDYKLLKESLYDFMHDIDLATNEKIYKIIIDYIKGDI